MEFHWPQRFTGELLTLATKVYRRTAHTGHSFDFHFVYLMSKKGESFRAYIMEILSYDKNIKTCGMQLITSDVIFNSALVSDK